METEDTEEYEEYEYNPYDTTLSTSRPTMAPRRKGKTQTENTEEFEYDPNDTTLPTPRPMRAPRRKGKTQNRATCIISDGKGGLTTCPGMARQCAVCGSTVTEEGEYHENNCKLGGPCDYDNCRRHVDHKCVEPVPWWHEIDE